MQSIFLRPKVDDGPAKLRVTGLVAHEGEKWIKHRRIINPAFYLEKLKVKTLTEIEFFFVLDNLWFSFFWEMLLRGSKCSNYL
jgi:hypothetical protein